MVLFVLQVDGRTALHYAAENDHAEVVKTLLKQGNVNPHTINNVRFFMIISVVYKLKPCFTFYFFILIAGKNSKRGCS